MMIRRRAMRLTVRKASPCNRRPLKAAGHPRHGRGPSGTESCGKAAQKKTAQSYVLRRCNLQRVATRPPHFRHPGGREVLAGGVVARLNLRLPRQASSSCKRPHLTRVKSRCKQGIASNKNAIASHWRHCLSMVNERARQVLASIYKARFHS